MYFTRTEYLKREFRVSISLILLVDKTQETTFVCNLSKPSSRHCYLTTMDILSGIDSEDTLKPSFFELLAQEQLKDLLQPALKYVLSACYIHSDYLLELMAKQVFAQRNPRYLLRLVNIHEELYALLMFFIEGHYLRKHG